MTAITDDIQLRSDRTKTHINYDHAGITQAA